jgi:hypothetical protein
MGWEEPQLSGGTALVNNTKIIRLKNITMEVSNGIFFIIYI